MDDQFDVIEGIHQWFKDPVPFPPPYRHPSDGVSPSGTQQQDDEYDE